MSKTYYSVLTTYGAQLFAQAMTNRQQVRITQFAVGDGGGRAVQPDSSRTSLVRQVHRANVSAVSQDPRNNKQVIFELTIPETVGGFWIREMGIYDAQNRLVAYANCPDTYKPRLEEGSGKVQVMRMILLVSSSNAVTLTVDDSVIFATRGQLTPKTITATSQNGIDNTGHTHQIDQASTTQAGIVQLDSSTTSTSETKAATPKAVKTVKDLADSNTRSLQNVIPNSKKSNSVASTSSDTVATSYAVKQAYDKAVEAKHRADSSYQVDNTNQNRNLTQLLGQNTVWGTAGREHSNLGLSADIYNYGVGLSMTSAGARAMLYIPHSPSGRNGGVWVQTNYSGNNAAPLWRRIDGADWDDVRNKVSASTSQAGITQLDNSTGSNAENRAATPKAIKIVKDLVDSNVRSLQNVIPNSKKSNAVNSTSSDTVATSYAVKQAYDLARGKQSPATTLAGYGITDSIRVDNTHLNTSLDGFFHTNTVWSVNGQDKQRVELSPEMYNFGVGVTLSSRLTTVSLYAPHRTDHPELWIKSHYNQPQYRPSPWERVAMWRDFEAFTGSIAFFATSSAPNGWLKANGAAVSRTTYAALFARIGTTFGTGDGQTTFNLPDLRGEFIRGWDDGRNVDVGRRFGEAQQGSLTTIDLSPDEQGTSIHGLSMRKLSNINTPKDLAKMAGFDLTNANDVNHFYQLWVAKTGYRYVDSQLATVAISNSAGDIGNGHINGFTRPRNVALLACIKY